MIYFCTNKRLRQELAKLRQEIRDEIEHKTSVYTATPFTALEYLWCKQDHIVPIADVLSRLLESQGLSVVRTPSVPSRVDLVKKDAPRKGDK